MKKVIKNILNEELERTREMMGLLVEQPSQIQFPIWETCQNGVVVAPFSSNNVFGQAVINPGNWNGVYDPMMWSQESQAFYSLMGSPNIGDVVQFDTTTDTTAAFQDAYGKCLKYIGISTCPYNPPYTNSPWDMGACSTYFGGALYENWSYIGACSDCLTCTSSQAPCGSQIDSYECDNNGNCYVDPTGQYTGYGSSQDNLDACNLVCSQPGPLDCDTGLPDYSPNQWAGVVNFMNTCDQKEALALAGGNGCNWICNRVNNLISQQPFALGTLGGDRKQCKLDYVQAAANNVPCTNSNTGNCTSGNQGATVSQTFINTMTTMYNGTGGPSGCWGLSGNNPNSVCGKKAYFCGMCPGCTPMQQAKCDWLTTFTSTNNCSC